MSQCLLSVEKSSAFDGMCLFGAMSQQCQHPCIEKNIALDILTCH